MNNQQGIALDIDDTLSNTTRYFIKRLQEKFGNPENLAVDEMIEKYQIMPNISYWQTEEIRKWMDEQGTNETQEKYDVLENALDVVREINKIRPVRMYITSRPSLVVEGTKRWLDNMGFPPAELVTRPMSKIKINGNAWKAEILKARFPEISGLVDDNPEVIEALGHDYPGTLYLYGHIGEKSTFPAFVKVCPTWSDVLKAIKQED